jgi:hypothetical protein
MCARGWVHATINEEEPAMRFWALGILVSVVASSSVSQQSVTTNKSPKALVEEFWKMETRGGRLTTEGWRSADRYFVRPIEPPNERVIGVVDNGFSIEDPYMRSGNTAVVTINVSGLA